MRVKYTELKGNPHNPRFLKDERFKKLKKSIEDFPEMLELRPIVVDEDYLVLGGNMRLKVIESLVAEGKTQFAEVNVTIAKGLTEEQKKEFIIKDNVGFGEWDWDILANEWDNNLLAEWGLEIDGFEEKAIEEDEAPDVSNEPAISKLGEVYQLGRHRLMCGDATKIEDVKRLMDDKKADMVFTDPPYNVDYTGKTKDALKIENDKMGNDTFYQFLYDAFINISLSVKSGAPIYVCHADSEGLNFRKAFIDAGFLLKQCIIWNKNSMVMGRQDYQWKHEPILYGWMDGGSHSFYGGRDQTTVWDIARPTVSKEHPTMKPIALIDKAIKNSSKSGDIILDVFGGSGSIIIACEQANRICYMMELDPKYCDVIRKRYWKYTHDNDENGWIEGTKL